MEVLHEGGATVVNDNSELRASFKHFGGILVLTGVQVELEAHIFSLELLEISDHSFLNKSVAGYFSVHCRLKVQQVAETSEFGHFFAGRHDLSDIRLHVNPSHNTVRLF